MSLSLNKIKTETKVIPVIAHIERYTNLRNEENYLELLKDMDVKYQVNAYSLEEEDNQEIKMFARELIDERIVTFIGSGVQQNAHRNVNMKRGIEYFNQVSIIPLDIHK